MSLAISASAVGEEDCSPVMRVKSWQNWHCATAGTVAASSVATVRWQNWQSSPAVVTCTVWGNAIGCVGPSPNPRTAGGCAHQACTKK